MKQLTLFSSDLSRRIKVEMTAEEYLAFVQGAQRRKKRTLKGLAGICELFKCSKSYAFHMSHQDWFQAAKVTNGRNFVFDVDVAWELAQKNEVKPVGKRA